MQTARTADHLDPEGPLRRAGALSRGAAPCGGAPGVVGAARGLAQIGRLGAGAAQLGAEARSADLAARLAVGTIEVDAVTVPLLLRPRWRSGAARAPRTRVAGPRDCARARADGECSSLRIRRSPLRQDVVDGATIEPRRPSAGPPTAVSVRPSILMAKVEPAGNETVSLEPSSAVARALSKSPA